MSAYAYTPTPGPTHLHTWVLTTADHTGVALEIPGAGDKTVHFVTAAAGSATITLEGSLDGVEFVGLNDPQGNAITATATGKLEAVLENVRWIRPRLSTVGTAATWTAHLLSRK